MSLVESFADTFGTTEVAHLACALSAFSRPQSLGEFLQPALFDRQRQQTRINIALWMLRHQLLTQLHTFVYLREAKEVCANEHKSP
jgi:hypothetical protein